MPALATALPFPLLPEFFSSRMAARLLTDFLTAIEGGLEGGATDEDILSVEGSIESLVAAKDALESDLKLLPKESSGFAVLSGEIARLEEEIRMAQQHCKSLQTAMGLGEVRDIVENLSQFMVACPLGGIITVEDEHQISVVHTELDAGLALVWIANELQIVRFHTPQETAPPRGTGTIVSRPETLEFRPEGLFHCGQPVCLGAVVSKKLKSSEGAEVPA